MASTCNKNSDGNYKAELKRFADHLEHQHYVHNSAGQAYTTHLPGLGLLAGQVHPSNLAKNNIDIESFLRGTRTTDLVNPQPPVEPQLKSLDSLNIHSKLPVILPSDLVPMENQRPLMS